MRTQLSVWIGLSAAAALLLTACGRQDSARQGRDARREQKIPAVEAVQVQEGTLPLEERLAGSVSALNQTQIFPEVGGRIVEVLANDGDWVEAGTPLVRLRDSEFEERLRQAAAGLDVAEARVKQGEADLARSEATLKRQRAMAERNLGIAADLDAADADARSAEAQLALMKAERQQAASLVAERRAALAETVIKAPVSGLVGGRDAEVGQLATTSAPLFVIGDPARMRVAVTLTQRMLGYIETGTPVDIVVDGTSGDVIKAGISRISPFLHPVARTTQAEIDLPDHGGRLRPGMFVTVDVLYGESRTAALVPNSAIDHDPNDGHEGVYVASLPAPGGVAIDSDAAAPGPSRAPLDPLGPVAVQFVGVKIVARGRETSAVEGVEPGQWVVTVGHHLLSTSEGGRALIQPTPWDHIMRLQQLQTRDLIEVIKTRQGELQEPVRSPN